MRGGGCLYRVGLYGKHTSWVEQDQSYVFVWCAQQFWYYNHQLHVSLKFLIFVSTQKRELCRLRGHMYVNRTRFVYPSPFHVFFLCYRLCLGPRSSSFSHCSASSIFLYTFDLFYISTYSIQTSKEFQPNSRYKASLGNSKIFKIHLTIFKSRLLQNVWRNLNIFG